MWEAFTQNLLPGVALQKNALTFFCNIYKKNTCAGIYVFNKFTNSWTAFSELFLCRALLGNYLVSIAKNSRVFPFSCSKVYGKELISNIYWELFCFCFLYIFLVLLSFFMFPFFIFNCFSQLLCFIDFFSLSFVCFYFLSTFIPFIQIFLKCYLFIWQRSAKIRMWTSKGNILLVWEFPERAQVNFYPKHCTTKWRFPIRTVNVTKSAENCRFGRIYRRNP